MDQGSLIALLPQPLHSQQLVQSGDKIIETIDLVKKYKLGGQTIAAIDGISITIREGEFVALVGASGSGKSTLLHLLGGLDRSSSGRVLVRGKNIAELSDRKLSMFRNQTIGFIFQSFYLQPFLTLRRNIEVAMMPSRMKRSERKQRIDTLTKQVGLFDRLNHRPRELSGGQIQRAAILRALVNHPRVILADEPTGNLDSKNSEDIISLFQTIREEYGTTIIIATHNHDIAKRADRIISLKDGVIV